MTEEQQIKPPYVELPKYMVVFSAKELGKEIKEILKYGQDAREMINDIHELLLKYNL
jgi:hypothetical protein